MQSYFNQMAGAMSDVDPEQMARMKDMFAALNQLLEQRERGEDTTPAFQQFMQDFGDFFPGNPETLEELLEQMAEQMAAMQAMLNSMTPEQRAQLEGLARQLLEDMDLRWQVDQLADHLRQAFPDAGWNRRYQFSGQDPLGFAEAAQLMNRLGDMDQLENLLRSATNPGALAEVDLESGLRIVEIGHDRLIGDIALRRLDPHRSDQHQTAEGLGRLARHLGRDPAAEAQTHQRNVAHAEIAQQPGVRRPPVRPVAGDGYLRAGHVGGVGPVGLGDAVEHPPQWSDAFAAAPVAARPSACRPTTSKWSAPRRSPGRPLSSCSTCRCRCRCATTSLPPRRWRWRCTR